MKNYYIFLYILFSILSACNNPFSYQNRPISNGSALHNDHDSSEHTKSNNTLMGDTSKFNFLQGCKEMESWIGAIQGSNLTPKTKLYGFKSCNNAEISFDLIFALKKEFNETELASRFANGEKTNYKDFLVYAFEIPMRASNDETDEHGDPNIYPSIVKEYKYLDSKWFFVKSRKIRNLTEYGIFMSESVQDAK